MEIGLFRGLVTAVLFVLFVGLWIWAWSSKRGAEFEAASRMPLADDAESPEDKSREQRQ